MILTVTLNPSVDIAYQLDHLMLDQVNRVKHVLKSAGGKGLNVTRVAHTMSQPVLATGFIGGQLGQFIKNELDQAGIKHDFIEIAGETRNCIGIMHEGQQTEINEPGPVISAAEASRFLNHFQKLVPQAQVVTLSGSLAKGLPADFYSQLIAICQTHQIPVILDASGQTLQHGIAGPKRPNVIKPNLDELSQISQRSITSDLTLIKQALSAATFEGIEWVIVSMGGAGAIAKHGSVFYRVEIPKVTVQNTVGSGDATVAGIAIGLRQGLDDVAILKTATSLGTLNAMEAGTGQVDPNQFQAIYDQVKVIGLD